MPPGSHGPPPTGVGKKGMAKDPICGMVVPKATALTSQRGGRDYYFCSQSCLQTFQNPDRELRVMRRRVGFVIGGVLALALLRAGAFIVLGVESELYRLVSNLLLNAIQYTPPGGEVVLRLWRVGSHGLLEVQDSGIGINPADQQRIFDRFFRSDPGRSRQQGVTGLGLSIVAAIVRRHRGRSRCARMGTPAVVSR